MVKRFSFKVGFIIIMSITFLSLNTFKIPNQTVNADLARLPRVVVFNIYHTFNYSIEGFTTNATTWGYEVVPTAYLDNKVLENTEILILNAPDFLTEEETTPIVTWWNSGNKTLWVAGDSDYGGYWNPADLNELIVDLGGHVIFVDDEVSDPVSKDGATYRVIANVTNPNTKWDDLLRTPWSPEIKKIFMQNPTAVVPWNGPNHGNISKSPGSNVTWDSIANIDWIINSSKYALIQDRDNDDDDVWESHTPHRNGSIAMVAVEWGIGSWAESKMIFTGKSIFSDYKSMLNFNKASFANSSIQNINLTHSLLDWSKVSITTTTTTLSSTTTESNILITPSWDVHFIVLSILILFTFKRLKKSL